MGYHVRTVQMKAGWLCAATVLATPSPASATDLISYFLPTPITNKLTANTWGDDAVLPRDVSNGLEDPLNDNWCYWDGKIIRAKDGKYHLFGSRWAEGRGHAGSLTSVAIHAVSEKLTGPYVDKGLAYSNQSGKGHNVTADVLPDGRYVLLVSETRPGDVFIAKSLDGPWELQGSIKVDATGSDAAGTTDALSLVVRPDGSFLMVTKDGRIMSSTTGVLGPYKVQGPSVYPLIASVNVAKANDPVIWYSGGQYHIVVNLGAPPKGYHLTSPDGITGWTARGVAFDPASDMVRYTDGTVNHWNSMQRPGVVLENGHVTAFSFAAVDVPVESELGYDDHGSKIIVVPFDGAQFDADSLPSIARDAGTDAGPDAPTIADDANEGAPMPDAASEASASDADSVVAPLEAGSVDSANGKANDASSATDGRQIADASAPPSEATAEAGSPLLLDAPADHAVREDGQAEAENDEEQTAVGCACRLGAPRARTSSISSLLAVGALGLFLGRWRRSRRARV